MAALGPKAAAAAGRRGTGLISFGLLDPAAWRALRQAAPGARSYLITALHVLSGADLDARNATGHVVLSLLAFAADNPAFAARLGPLEQEAVRKFLVLG